MAVVESTIGAEPELSATRKWTITASVMLVTVMQVIVRLAPGETLQAWVQNQGVALPFQQGMPISIHLPAEAVRVLVDPDAAAGTGARTADVSA